MGEGQRWELQRLSGACHSPSGHDGGRGLGCNSYTTGQRLVPTEDEHRGAEEMRRAAAAVEQPPPPEEKRTKPQMCESTPPHPAIACQAPADVAAVAAGCEGTETTF